MLTLVDVIAFYGAEGSPENREARRALGIEDDRSPAPSTASTHSTHHSPGEKAMPSRRSLTRTAMIRIRRRSRADDHADFAETRNLPLMEAVAAAGALIAHADGWVTPEERRRLVGFIRQQDGLSVFGPEEVLVLFERLADRLAEDPDSARNEALATVMRLRDRRRQARMLMEACCQIAAADGMFDAEERQEALRIASMLKLDPARYDLAEAS